LPLQYTPEALASVRSVPQGRLHVIGISRDELGQHSNELLSEAPGDELIVCFGVNP
jgi:hypothetical protein